ncbi:nucleoside diphosphate kinase 3 isoform X1 [Anser cygnoides]|uniref:nucleoside diphosphate kinase 3 isoform X1 n=2 Tax=Anserinae TaxID=2068722 RepID=UPI0034D2A786
MICLVLAVFASVLHCARPGATERTFVAIKPDGVQRQLVGEIIRRFERKGFRLLGLKLLQASEELLKEHYVALRDRPFYGRLVKYMSSGPVVAMVWQGLDVVKMARMMIGETNPAESLPGTIRGDFCIDVGRSPPSPPLLLAEGHRPGHADLCLPGWLCQKGGVWVWVFRAS